MVADGWEVDPGDELRFPTNGSLGYRLAYPLMIAVLIELSLLFLTVGIVLELAHAAAARARRFARWIS